MGEEVERGVLLAKLAAASDRIEADQVKIEQLSAVVEELTRQIEQLADSDRELERARQLRAQAAGQLEAAREIEKSARECQAQADKDFEAKWRARQEWVARRVDQIEADAAKRVAAGRAASVRLVRAVVGFAVVVCGLWLIDHDGVVDQAVVWGGNVSDSATAAGGGLTRLWDGVLEGNGLAITMGVGLLAVVGVMVVVVVVGLRWGKQRHHHYQGQGIESQRQIVSVLIVVAMVPVSVFMSSWGGTWPSWWLGLAFVGLVVYHTSPEAPRWVGARLRSVWEASLDDPQYALGLLMLTIGVPAAIYVLVKLLS